MSENTSMSRPYDGLKIVEYSDVPSGEMLGQLLGDLGANIVKIEPPMGAASRREAPFVKGKTDSEHSLNFWYYNTNKKSAVLDLETREGKTRLQHLLQDADIFIVTLQPYQLKELGLDLAALQADFPKLIIISVTPFGLTGPWADYKVCDLVSFALSGMLFSCGYDDHSIPPMKPHGPQSHHTATSFAHSAAMLALLERQTTGQGQLVDVSIHESCAVTVELSFLYWAYTRAHVERQTCRAAMTVRTQPAVFLCGDGKYVYLIIILAETNNWNNLVRWLDSKGLAGDLTDAKFSDLPTRQNNFDHIQNIVECFFLMHDAEQMFREGQAHNLPIGIINAPEDLIDHPHWNAREFFKPVEYEDTGPVIYPGAPALYSEYSNVPRIRAPKLGEHTEDVLREISEKQ